MRLFINAESVKKKSVVPTAIFPQSEIFKLYSILRFFENNLNKPGGGMSLLWRQYICNTAQVNSSPFVCPNAPKKEKSQKF